MPAARVRLSRGWLTSVILLSCCATLNAEARQWRSADGAYSVMATFVKSAQGRVDLKKQDGSTVTVRLDALSDSDREWVANHSDDAGGESPAPLIILPGVPTFSADEALLLRMASQGYIKGRKRVAELDEPQSLVRLANQRGDTLPLARLILCRELKSKSLVEVRAEMGEHFAGAVEALQGAVLDSANRQGAGGMQLGDDGQTLFNAPTDLLGEIEEISAGLGDTVSGAVNADRQQRDLMREAWELEGAVGRRVEQQFQLDQLPPLAEDAVALNPSHGLVEQHREIRCHGYASVVGRASIDRHGNRRRLS